MRKLKRSKIFSSTSFADKGISIRSGLHCAPLAHKFLKTFPAGALRFSVNCLTSDEDFLELEDALDAISKKLDALLEAKAEPKKDEEPVAEPKADEAPAESSVDKPAGVGDSMPSLPQYTQSLGAIEKGYSLDDAFNRLKGRR